MQETTDWELESTDDINIESTAIVGTDPATGNALPILTMYDPRKEFSELCTDEKLTELLPLRYRMQIMQHRIAVIPDSHWSIRFTRTHMQLKEQITQKINTEQETRRVAPSKSSNAIGMFTQTIRNIPHKARFLLNGIPRTLVTHKDKTPMSRRE